MIYSQNQNNSLSLGRIAPVLWQTTANVFVRDCGQGHAPVRNAPRSSIRPNLQPLSTSAPHRRMYIHVCVCVYMYVHTPLEPRRQSVESGIMCVCVDIIIMVWFMFIVCFMQPYTCSSFRPFLCSYSDSDSGSDSDSDSDSDSYSYSYSYSHFNP